MEALAGLLLPNLVILAAAALQTATGIGFGLISVPLLGLIDLAWLPAPVLQANVLLSLAMAVRGHAALDRAEAPPLLAGLTLGTAIGAGILTLIARDQLGLVIGALVCLAVLVSVAAPPVALTRRRILAASTVGGVTGVVAVMHAPPLIALYQREHPEKVRATMGVVFVAGSMMALATLALTGLYGRTEIVAGLVLLPGVAAGFVFGRVVAGRVPARAARIAMLSVATAGGLALIVRSL